VGGTAPTATTAGPRRASHAAAGSNKEGARSLVNAQARAGDRPAETVAGVLATLAIFGSLLALDYRPIRITPFTILISLIAAGIGGRHQRLAAAALAISGVCFILGTFFAIITNHPIF
jgi:hypothetical protein